MNVEVSIVVPVFNAANFLAATLSSVQSQTFSKWELLIAIDPKSQDQSFAIAQAFSTRDQRIKLLQAQHPGVAAARNLAMHNSRGEYLAYLDSDDLWLPEKLSTQLRAMRAHGARVSCTAYRRLSQDERRVGRRIRPPNHFGYARLKQQNCILLSTAMLKRELARPFREVGCEDFAHWLEILAKGEQVLGLQEDLARYRVVAGSRGASHWRSWRESWQVLSQRPEATLSNTLVQMSLLSARGALKHSRF